MFVAQQLLQLFHQVWHCSFLYSFLVVVFSSKLNSQPVPNKAQANLSQRSSAKLREEIASVKDELHTTQAQGWQKKVTKIGKTKQVHANHINTYGLRVKMKKLRM